MKYMPETMLEPFIADIIKLEQVGTKCVYTYTRISDIYRLRVWNFILELHHKSTYLGVPLL